MTSPKLCPRCHNTGEVVTSEGTAWCTCRYGSALDCILGALDIPQPGETLTEYGKPEDPYRKIETTADVRGDVLHVTQTVYAKGYVPSVEVEAHMASEIQCMKCRKLASELCQDGYCRECHVSLTFEDCVSGAWVREQRRAAGLPDPK